MSIRAEELEMSFSLDGTTFSVLGGERAITTPARDMNMKMSDMPPKWAEKQAKLLDQPKFGQRDYFVTKFSLMDGSKERANISFETIVYKDQKTAMALLIGTLSHMTFLRLTKVEVGDVGAMIEVRGRADRRLKAVAFVERNVFGLIMLSAATDYTVSDSWLISMARLMVSRMR